MAYTMLISFILLYTSRRKVNSEKFFDFVRYFAPIGVLLILFLSLQYDVGTDYFSYLSVAEGTKSINWIKHKAEYLFVTLVYLARWIGVPQLIFAFSGTIQVFFLMLITYEVKKIGYKLTNFFFLYFTLALVFFNQFNGIRQYIAVYIIVYALFKLREDKKILFVSLVILARLFHASAIYFIILLFIKELLDKKISFNVIFICLLVLVILSFVNLDDIYIKILSYTPYKHYATSNYFSRMSIRGIITKIPKIIIVLFASYLIEKKIYKVNKADRFLLNMSYISLAVMILTFSSTLIWRFYQYFDLFIIFPVLTLMENGYKKSYEIMIISALVAMLIVKILIIPQGEYLYRSILF